MNDKQNPLSSEDSHAYWINRHKKHEGEWQAIGYSSGDLKINQAFYDCRKQALLKAVCKYKGKLQGLQVLDVGCGLGVFSQIYHEAGAEVYGIDISPEAINYCDSLKIGNFICAGVGDVPVIFDKTFDIIHCFDVLYHVTDDDEWAKAISGFDSVSGRDTLWLFTEFHIPKEITAEAHLVKRPISKYRNQLAKHERDILEEIPLYWLFNAVPSLATRYPKLITKADRFGRIGKKLLQEYVAMWVIGPSHFEATVKIP